VVEAIGPMIDRPALWEAAPGQYDGRPEKADFDADFDAERRRVTGLLGATAIGVDDLIRLSELTPAQVITILLELELAGRLDRHAGNRVSIS
jgi:DNA processing protein